MTGAGHPGGTESFVYDDRGMVARVSGPAGLSSFVYDGDGRLVSRVDAAGTASGPSLK